MASGSIRPSQDGFTLVELVIVVSIVMVMVSIAVPRTGRWLDKQRLLGSGQDAAAAFSYARGEAVRTGRLHLVFFGADTGGLGLIDAAGAAVDMLVIDDGRPGDATQNCAVDAGEAVQGYTLRQGVTFGVSQATATAPADGGTGNMATGTTFTDVASLQASWVMFRPEGVSLSFSADCSTGAIGSGTGGLYLTDGRRDLSVVLTPLGMSRAHSWDLASGTWGS